MTPRQFRAWRTAKGWTQTKAGEALGVTLRQVQRYESGEQGISPSIAKLCSMLGKEKDPAIN